MDGGAWWASVYEVTHTGEPWEWGLSRPCYSSCLPKGLLGVKRFSHSSSWPPEQPDHWATYSAQQSGYGVA